MTGHRTIQRAGLQLTNPHFASPRLIRVTSRRALPAGRLRMVRTFGDFEFDDQRRCLESAGRRVRLSGQVVDLLSLLLEGREVLVGTLRRVACHGPVER